MRITAFKALVGSINYHLETPESDKDFKHFILPIFDDLYYRNVFTESKVGDVDEEYHDIRKLVNLFWKSNVNFLEVLFSNDITVSNIKWVKDSIDEMFAMKNQIAAMNLPYLYKACQGMYVSKAKYIDQGNKATKNLVEKFGYDTKSAMHAYRILDFAERYAKNEFTDFKKAIQYDEMERNFMLSIKHGALSKDQYDKELAEKMKSFKRLAAIYQAQPIKEETKKSIESIIYQLVSKNILNELHQ